MARRQILSLSERESLLALPDDELTLTRMTYFSEQDLAIINAHRKPASRFGFAVLLCYLKSIGIAPDKKSSSPAKLLKTIGARLKLSAELWQEYVSGRDTTRREHMRELYRYLELKAFNGAHSERMYPASAPSVYQNGQRHTYRRGVTKVPASTANSYSWH